MNYLSYQSIRSVHIEPTSRCNLLCPQCSRVHENNINPAMPVSDLSWKTLEPTFTKEFCSNLRHVYFCGNYGDPLASNLFLEILENLHARGVPMMSVFTNGSLRDPVYFRDLVKLLGPEGKVVFAIDGLSDTNHIYRRGSNWSKIENNLRSFIGAGGRVRWDYLIFEHNAHQVDEARELARSLGVVEFRAKSTTQFIESTVAKGLKKINVLSVKNKKTGEENVIKPVEKSLKLIEKVQKITEEHGSFDQYILDTDIRCKTRAEKNIYIDFTGKVWPCCWMGSGRFHPDPNRQSRKDHEIIENLYGNDFNQLNSKQTLIEILEHPFFKNDLVDSWLKKGDLEKLWTCGFTCGKKFEASTGASTPIEKL